MDDNGIYFNTNFKSFDITKWTSRSSVWYEWVERSRRLIRSTTLSSSIVEWICFTLREASRDQKNVVRRWKSTDGGSEHFSSRKHNQHGRFMSILSFNKGERSVLIIPEPALNACWCDIAFNI